MDNNIQNIEHFLIKGNLPQAELLCRIFLEKEPNNPIPYFFLGLIARAINSNIFAETYFQKAHQINPDWNLPKQQLEDLRTNFLNNQKLNSHLSHTPKEKYLFIKAWGCGFWSDVDHVLCQLLIAEITDRIPVVHWGSNSLFGDGTDNNAFNFFFNPLSQFTISDLLRKDFSFFPPKWNCNNLKIENYHKFDGPYSRMASIYYLNRQETVVVSDFYTPIILIKPWIPQDHPLYGLSTTELYKYLIKKYLHPRAETINEIDDFYLTKLASSKFISVHMRGSDKIHEVTKLGDRNNNYFNVIDNIKTYDHAPIFLMTDDIRLLNMFLKKYDKRVITTNCQRTNNSIGIHLQHIKNKRLLGMEVMIDTYLAAKGEIFIGNGFSNPSCFVLYLKDWDDKNIHLVHRIMHNFYSTYQLLYNRRE